MPRSASRALSAVATTLVAGLLVALPLSSPSDGTALPRICVAHAQSWTSFTGLEVSAVRIEGVRGDFVEPLRKGLALTPRSQLFGQKRAVLREDLVESDRQRVLLYLARRGFPEAQVDVRVERTREREHVRVVFVVTAGARFTVGSVTLEGVDDDLRRALEPATDPLRGNVPFGDAQVRSVRDDLLDRLAREGYARSSIEIDVATGADRRASVVYRIRAGARYRFGTLEVNGVAEDLERLARSEAVVPTGEVYRPSVITNARDDLRSLGLFRQVNVKTTVADSTTLHVRADLSARAMRTLEFSVGTWSDHPVQVEAMWRHRNLFERGRGVLVEGAYALRRQFVAGAFEWPSLLARRSVSQWRAELEIEDEEAYYLDVLRLRWSNLFRLTRISSLRLGVSLVETDLQVQASSRALFDVEAGRQLILDGQWFLDAVDDPLDPSRGWRLQFETQWAPAIDIVSAPFVGARTGIVRVQPVWGRTRLASRIDVAWATPLGSAEDLLPSQRWFAGGFNTMRGTGRRGLGPADADGDPVGGQVRLLSGAELRIPLKGIFGISTFVDTGQVWDDPASTRWRDIAVAVGGGLLLYTPIGPVHLEVARNVGVLPIDGSRTQIQLGIGHPY